jgi:hypothetical protein
MLREMMFFFAEGYDVVVTAIPVPANNATAITVKVF